MEQIAVFFCKNFAEIVRKTQYKEPYFLETAHSFVEGFLSSVGNTATTVMPQGPSDFIEAMGANGYTVTAYLRLSDFLAFVPFTDEFEMSAALAVNGRILGKVFPEAPSN